jgi:cell division protein FtsL
MSFKENQNKYKRNNKVYKYDEYIDGSAVRKLQEFEETKRVPKRPPITPEAPSKKRRAKEISSVSKASFLGLIVAIAFTLFTCVEFLKTQTEVSSMNRQIDQLQKEITTTKEENTVHLSKLNATLDLDAIYDIATNELGMIRPSKEQIIIYESTISDYVKQYEDIPEK